MQLSDVMTAVSTELNDKLNRITTHSLTSPHLQQVLSAEVDSLTSDARVAKRAFNQMYWADEFYMRTLDRHMETACTATRFVLSRDSSVVANITP